MERRHGTPEVILKDKPNISIVMPVYNERESMLLLYAKIRDACDTLDEIVFVNYGSRNGTGKYASFAWKE